MNLTKYKVVALYISDLITLVPGVKVYLLKWILWDLEPTFKEKNRLTKQQVLC